MPAAYTASLTNCLVAQQPPEKRDDAGKDYLKSRSSQMIRKMMLFESPVCLPNIQLAACLILIAAFTLAPLGKDPDPLSPGEES